jgi:ferredoxin
MSSLFKPREGTRLFVCPPIFGGQKELAHPTFFFLVLALFAVSVDAADKPTYRSTKKLPDLHHAVGLELEEGMKTPKDWPLDGEGKLQCATCHGQKNMEDKPFDEVDKKAADFLRGGPYDGLEDFCARCHDAKKHERPNIHLMLKADGSIDKQHCSYCHEEVQEEPNRPHRREEWKLRLPADRLCYGCHLKTPHLNALQHQAAKPSDRIKRRMKKSVDQEGRFLPLSDDGKVMCATCHSPHPPGVIDPAKNPAGVQIDPADIKEGTRYRESAWNRIVQKDKQKRLEEMRDKTGEPTSLTYRRIDKEVLLRLPAKNGKLCLSCHDFDR